LNSITLSGSTSSQPPAANCARRLFRDPLVTFVTDL
jgi:hypothetical protein